MEQKFLFVCFCVDILFCLLVVLDFFSDSCDLEGQRLKVMNTISQECFKEMFYFCTFWTFGHLNFRMKVTVIVRIMPLQHFYFFFFSNLSKTSS